MAAKVVGKILTLECGEEDIATLDKTNVVEERTAPLVQSKWNNAPWQQRNDDVKELMDRGFGIRSVVVRRDLIKHCRIDPENWGIVTRLNPDLLPNEKRYLGVRWFKAPEITWESDTSVYLIHQHINMVDINSLVS